MSIKLQYLLTNIQYILFFLPFFQWIAMTMSDGNFAKKLSPIMEDFEEEKLKRWESDESTNVCEEFISRVIWAISIIFIVVTFPFSLCVSIRMVQVRNLNVIIFYLLPIHILLFGVFYELNEWKKTIQNSTFLVIMWFYSNEMEKSPRYDTMTLTFPYNLEKKFFYRGLYLE